MTTKLTDLQLVLLSTAAQRADGNLLPPPETVAGQAARIKKTIPPLLKRELVSEVEVTEEARVWRQDGEIGFGLVITDVGRAAIGDSKVTSTLAPAPTEMPPPVAAPASEAETDGAAAPKPGSKIATVLDLLRRDGGATLAEMIEATGWLPHTTRAALTGLRKKGHGIVRSSRDGTTAYTLAA